MNMKEFAKYLKMCAFAIFSLLAFSSCLESGLDDLESFSDAELLDFKFEYRWEQAMTGEGHNTQLAVVSLPTTIKKEGTTLTCTINVPVAGNPSFFTEEIRKAVSLNKLVGMVTISTAAKIIPIGDAPVLGKWGDFSKERKYKVVAADGKTNIEYTIKCVLNK